MTNDERLLLRNTTIADAVVKLGRVGKYHYTSLSLSSAFPDHAMTSVVYTQRTKGDGKRKGQGSQLSSAVQGMVLLEQEEGICMENGIGDTIPNTVCFINLRI